MPSARRWSSVSHVSVRPGPSQPFGFLPVNFSQQLDRLADGRALVGQQMHRPLDDAVAHELPAAPPAWPARRGS